MAINKFKSSIIDDPEKIKYLHELNAADITKNFLMINFLDTDKVKAPFNFNDLFVLDPSLLIEANKPFLAKRVGSSKKTVTIGNYISNLFLFDKFGDKIKYYTGTFDKKMIGNIDSDVGLLVLENKISYEVYSDFLDRFQWLGLVIVKFISPSFDYESNMVLPEIQKLRAELFKKYEKEIASNDQMILIQIEEELLAKAKEVLDKDSPDGYELFQSGVAQFGNHYKNVSVMRGNLPRSAKNDEFNLCSSTLLEGIKKDEIHKFADLSVLASFSRSVNTQQGGYLVKKYMAGFQHLKLDPANSDCGSSQYIDVTLTEKNFKEYYFRFVKEGSHLVCLTSDNKSNYIGKTVKMRSPIYCLSKNICNKCAGDLYYRMNIKNIGLLTGRVGSKLLNAALKFFHNVKTTIHKIEIDGTNCKPINMTEI